MQTADQLDLESLKLVNKIYEMRQFIYAAIIRPEKTKDQLFAVNPEFVKTIELINTEFRKLFKEQDQIVSFLNVFLGDEVDKEVYIGGLLQNKPKGFYDFLNHPKNRAIKKFFRNHLEKLDDVWQAWQTYDITHTHLTTLIKECNNEVNKKITRTNIDALKKENKRTRTQPPIKIPELNSTRPTPPIHIPLENPEEFPCTARLLRALQIYESNQLAKNIKSLLSIYQQIKQLTSTIHFPLLIELDKYIINALSHTNDLYLTDYCNLVLESIPENFVLGKEWFNNAIPAKDKINTEQYWRQFFELLTTHLQQHPNLQLQALINKLNGNLLDNDDIGSCKTEIDSSQDKVGLSQLPLGENDDLIELPIEWPWTPFILGRSQSDISATLAQHSRNTLFAAQPGNFQRCNSASIITSGVNNDISVGDGAPSFKRKRE